MIQPASVAMPLNDGLEDLANWSINGNWTTANSDPHGGSGYAEGVSRPDGDSALAVTLDLTGMNWPVLKFYDRFFDNSTGFHLEYSTDGFSWSEIARFNGDQPQWRLKQYDLSAWKNHSVFFLRFRIDASTDASAYWRLDDLKVENHAANLAVMPWSEGFESGLGDWITDWRLDATDSYEGANAVRSVGADGGAGYSYLTYGREMTVPDGADQSLSFRVKDTSTNDYSWYEWFWGIMHYPDVLLVQISQDGGLNWATLSSESDCFITEFWAVRQVSLAGYKGQTVRLRFVHNYYDPSTFGNFILDNIATELTPTPPQPPQAVALTGLTQSGRSVKLGWTESISGTDFKEYRVYRSGDGSTWSLIETVTDVVTTNLTDTGVLYGNRYYYRVDVVCLHELATASTVLNMGQPRI